MADRAPTYHRRRLAGFALAVFALIGAGITLTFSGSTQAQAPATDPAESPIRKVLDDQARAWNRGDLDTFLDGYWRSPRVVFQSGGTRHDGFDAMRDRYRKSYQADGKAMGQLTFSGLEVERLGPDAAFVRGRFTLTMPDGSHPTGLFTLIMRQFADGWKITHDHTSSEPVAPPPPPPPPTQPKIPG